MKKKIPIRGKRFEVAKLGNGVLSMLMIIAP
jgi:hypothetical protein